MRGDDVLERLSTIRQTIASVWPMVRSAIASGQFWSPQCVLTQPDPDVLCEYDVRIPLRRRESLRAHAGERHDAPPQQHDEAEGGGVAAR
jgi:hypothetical protein